MFGLSIGELLIVGIVAVILFGSRLPSVARSLGQSLTEFKRGMNDINRDVSDSIYSEPAGHVGYDKDTADDSHTPEHANSGSGQ